MYKGYERYKLVQLIDVDLGPYTARVARRLRSAKYYSYHKIDIAKAIENYKQALRYAIEDGFNKLSDEVLGIWIMHGETFERNEMPTLSIAILEERRQEIMDWMQANGDKPELAGERTRLLNWAVKIGHKIGGLYSNRYEPDKQLSEKYLVWAVETSMAEIQRRQIQGVKPNEGDFLDADQMGAQLEGEQSL